VAEILPDGDFAYQYRMLEGIRAGRARGLPIGGALVDLPTLAGILGPIISGQRVFGVEAAWNS